MDVANQAGSNPRQMFAGRRRLRPDRLNQPARRPRADQRATPLCLRRGVRRRGRCFLGSDGLQVEHIITLGWRGASDTRVRKRLSSPGVLLLTQDEDVLFGGSVASIVVVSRARQARRLTDRIEVWSRAVGELLRIPQAQRLFELRTKASACRGETHPQKRDDDRRRVAPASRRTLTTPQRPTADCK